MCCCEKPTINGESGYCWNDPNGPTGIYPVDPPPLEDGDVLLYDEPGRCGSGLDSHSYHYRLIKHCGLWLYVRHGGGDERIYISSTEELKAAFAALDSTARYWIFNAIYHAHRNGASDATVAECTKWQTAAAEKRIKTRKHSSQGYHSVKVWIEAQNAVEKSL